MSVKDDIADILEKSRGEFVSGQELAQRLGALGVKLDKAANKVRGELKVISAKGSKIPVVIIPTNEELMIAKDTVRVLGK